MSFSFSPYLIKNHRDPKYVYVKNMQCAAETFLGIKVSCHKILPEVCHKLKKVEVFHMVCSTRNINPIIGW